MKRTALILAGVTALALAGCAAGGSGVVPGSADALRTTKTLKPIPVEPSPTPTPNPGLLGSVISLVDNLACGVSSGVTCHVIPGKTKGLPAATLPSLIPGLHPADLQAAYALPSATAGDGQTVGIAVAYDNPNLEADLAVYRKKFGLPPCTTANGCFKKIALVGLNGIGAGNQGWGQESSLDVQAVSAVCPRCHIVVVEALDNAKALLDAAKVAVANGATVVSDSYSIAESPTQQDGDYAIGVPFVFGAGDWGAQAQWPAASSHVIAVGGTSLTPDGSARGWSETVWSATGGGCSKYVAKPAWQHDAGCANRTANDIAAFADPNPGVAVYDSFLTDSPGWRTYGGTSAAAPIVAGAIALAGNGKSVLLDASYIYAHAASLNPVTSGRNGTCGTYLCSAGNGYSAPAGNGALNGIAGL